MPSNTSINPNYAIKRDLRENTSFKSIIGRVGPLFWLLGPGTKKQKVCWLFEIFFSFSSFSYLVAIKPPSPT